MKTDPTSAPGNLPFGRLIESVSRLRELVPAPLPDALSMLKETSFIDKHLRDFIALSPYVMIATSGQEGRCDASPRGGVPGFVKVVDDHHLLFAEASGNRRADSLVNILHNPRIGMLFLVPGYEETVRINGTAFITEDAELLRNCEFVNGYQPLVGVGVRVEECYQHCAKASLRSSLWNPMGWPDLSHVATPAQMLMDHAASRGSDRSIKDVQLALNDSYTNRL
uniref:MSMEG_1061 family FMN-dependent PPOX-type flavoprotein n=1 Tax=Variovorax sp. BK018 TaxID=3450241 RepID=UPI0040397AE0